jgi:hypothetical protein
MKVALPFVSLLVLAAVVSAVASPTDTEKQAYRGTTIAPKALTFANYQRIKIGMTRDQVESIIGPERWEVEPVEPQELRELVRVGHLQWMPQEWWGRDGIIQVWFERFDSPEGRVSKKDFVKHRCEVKPLGSHE